MKSFPRRMRLQFPPHTLITRRACWVMCTMPLSGQPPRLASQRHPSPDAHSAALSLIGYIVIFPLNRVGRQAIYSSTFASLALSSFLTFSRARISFLRWRSSWLFLIPNPSMNTSLTSSRLSPAVSGKHARTKIQPRKQRPA